MQCVTKFLKARVFLTLACALTVLLPGTCIAESTAARMQKVVQQFVKETGNEVVGLGSWIRGGQYRDVLTFGDVAKASDHDLRLVVRSCPIENVELAAAKWAEGRRDFIRLVNKEFGSDAQRVLEKTNLYAPSQLMATVQDTEDATRLFVQRKQVPNLGYHSEVTKKTPAKFTEGLYGDGAAAWTQEYERDFGTRFYKSGNDVFSGGTEGLHAAEGKKLLSSTGAANVSRQWVAHATECIKGGDGKSLGKYLERIERDLTRSRGFIGAAADETWRTEMRTLATQLKSNPSSSTLSVLEHRVAQVLQRASVESAILARFKGSTLTHRAILRAILNSIQQGDELGRKILEAAAKVPAALMIDTLFKAVGAWELGVAFKEGDYTAAWVAAGTILDPTVIGLLLQITQLTIESAKDAGASLVGNMQDCEDLMAGIFNGRSIEVTEKIYTHEQLFVRLKEELEIKSFVEARAKQASALELGERNAEYDPAVAKAKYDKCYPRILNVWKRRRDQLETEYESLFDEVANAELILTYTPNPLRLDSKTNKAIVTVSVREPNWFAAKLNRMKNIANELTGAWPSVLVYYTWSEDTSQKGGNQKQYEYDAPGYYKVTVTRKVSAEAYGRKASAKRLDKPAEAYSESIYVDVEGREADGTYVGELKMTSLSFVNEKGETSTVNLLESPASTPFELVIDGESSRASVLMPGDNIPISLKDAILSGQLSAASKTPLLRGQFNAVNKGIFMDEIDKTYFRMAPSGKDGVKKVQGNMSGRLTGADSASGTWEAYIAIQGSYDIPINSQGDRKIRIERGSVRMNGTWNAKLKREPLKPKPSSTGGALKSKTKNPSSTGTASKSGKK